MDIFDKVQKNKGHLGSQASFDNNFYMFPKLEGSISPHMLFQGHQMINWSLNNYLGLANHPEVRKIDEEASKQWGLAYPMGARMLTGNTVHHEEFEKKLSDFVKKEASMLLNYGYQGIMSIIDAIASRHDVIVYDAESHACIIDGVRLFMGKRFAYPHNNIEKLEHLLKNATKIASEQNGGVLVITEGVFGMSGNQGKLKEIVALKQSYSFRLLVDDAHGFGTMGKTGAGVGEEQNVQEGIDLYFATFAKSMASIGAFIAGEKDVITYLKYNTRSQIFAKSLPMAFVIGGMKRLELVKTNPELRKKLWDIVHLIQDGFKKNGFHIGTTQSPVTPVLLKGGVLEAANLIKDLRLQYKIFCSGIIYPVVPKDVIMLRIIPTAAHTVEDVKITIDAFKSIKTKLDAEEYAKAGIEGAKIS
ncbi:MAG: pyridoxal phosphate-dependent aminotransferase family protein [Chitinophagaceae bacterium]|nr:pyridoxal phosphate-dependent aminotransferase family protein [Chitinophagaceae bacterium]